MRVSCGTHRTSDSPLRLGRTFPNRVTQDALRKPHSESEELCRPGLTPPKSIISSKDVAAVNTILHSCPINRPLLKTLHTLGQQWSAPTKARVPSLENRLISMWPKPPKYRTMWMGRGWFVPSLEMCGTATFSS